VKRLFYLSASILMLALAIHFGYTNAKAQGPGNPAVALANEGTGGYMLALTANGDLYRAQGYTRTYSFELVGNIFSGGPTPALKESWGSLKARYAPKSAPTSQPPTDR
jgi:hypothetical protein